MGIKIQNSKNKNRSNRKLFLFRNFFQKGFTNFSNCKEKMICRISFVINMNLQLFRICQYVFYNEKTGPTKKLKLLT